MKTSIDFLLDSKAEQYIPKTKMEWISKDQTKYNLNNIAWYILFKSIDENIFYRVKVFPTRKEVWDELIRIREWDYQEKDNKLTIAFKKFADFKQLPNKTITDMRVIFSKIINEIRRLEKELS